MILRGAVSGAIEELAEIQAWLDECDQCAQEATALMKETPVEFVHGRDWIRYVFDQLRLLYDVHDEHCWEYRAELQMDVIVASIEIGRYGKEAAEKLQKQLEGRSFMRLQVIVAPDEGEWVVTVQTTREGTTNKALQQMVTSVLASDSLRP